MHRNGLTATVLAGCVIALAACTAQGDSKTDSNAAAAAPATVVERARQALSDAGLPSDLKLLTSEEVNWNDSSLGCPQPGAVYAQVITPGHVLRFAERDGAMREVHVAGDTALVCSPQLGTGAPKRPAAAYRARDLDAVVESARADLAAKLNLKIDDVSLRNFEPTVWPDSRLGCGEPVTGDAASGPVRGFKLVFATSVQYYTYHTDLKRAFPCPPIAAE